MDAYRELQENLFDYFDKFDDKTFVAIVDSLVYSKPATLPGVSKIIEDFLQDNGLTEVFINYTLDRQNEQQFFRRATMSQTNMIDNIKSGLLSLSHNRFRNYV